MLWRSLLSLLVLVVVLALGAAQQECVIGEDGTCISNDDDDDDDGCVDSHEQCDQWKGQGTYISDVGKILARV